MQGKIPPSAKAVKKYIMEHGGPGKAKLPSFFAKGGRGRSWQNKYGRLKVVDESGNTIKYYEYDIKSLLKNKGGNGSKRNRERIVIGSNGEAWYTRDHYRSFLGPF